MNMAGLGGWRGLSRALKCFGVRGFLRRVRQDHKVARCMAHNLARARKSESIRARIWYPGGYPGIPEDTRIREPSPLIPHDMQTLKFKKHPSGTSDLDMLATAIICLRNGRYGPLQTELFWRHPPLNTSPTNPKIKKLPAWHYEPGCTRHSLFWPSNRHLDAAKNTPVLETHPPP